MPTATDPVSQAIAAYNAHTGAAGPQGPQGLPTPPAAKEDRSPGAFLGDLWDAITGPSQGSLPSQAKGALGVVEGPFKGGGKKAAPKKAATTKKATTTEDPTLSELESEIAAGNVWNQLGQQLVGQQEALIKPVEESISGALTAPAEASATNQALSSMGLAPNSSASKWLSENITQANKNDTPLESAMNMYTKEYEQGQGGVSSALSGMGQANALDISTAPQADWLQSLIQHIQSNVNYYGQYGSAEQAASVIPAVQAALSQSGGGGQGVSGSIPVTDTPQQIAALVQQYYTKQANGTLPTSGSAALKAAGGGTGGVIPSDTGTAPG